MCVVDAVMLVTIFLCTLVYIALVTLLLSKQRLCVRGDCNETVGCGCVAILLLLLSWLLFIHANCHEGTEGRITPQSQSLGVLHWKGVGLFVIDVVSVVS